MNTYSRDSHLGFSRNDLKCLEDIYGTLLKGIQPLQVASTADLLDAINSTNSSLARNFGAEKFISRNIISQTFNNALCFSLYLPFVFFVFLTALMTVWLNYSRNLATLVYTGVLGFFYQMFHFMDDNAIFDPLNTHHISALHHVFLPLINQKLKIWQQAWSSH